MVKGYVVRGKHETQGDVAAWSSDGSIGEQAGASVFKTLDGAAGARASMVHRGLADVRIFAVAEDGTETPLPTYEEALAERAALERCANTWRETADRYCDAIAERDAEIERLKAALRQAPDRVPHLDPVTSVAAEVADRIRETSGRWPARGDHDRLAEAHARIAAMPKEQRREAYIRASRSYSAPRMCVEHDGCTRDGDDIVWPDGERWPTRTKDE